MNTEELKQKALAGPVERQVLNARDEWLKCNTKEAAHWAARGLKVRDLYDFNSATILALIAERDELLAALKIATASLGVIGMKAFKDRLLMTPEQVREYATSRVVVAMNAIDKVEG